MYTKICSCCKNILPLLAFHKGNNKKYGVQSYCIECQQKYNRINNEKYRLEYLKIMTCLKINGCALCGYGKCNMSLDFHHVNSEDKKFMVNTRCVRDKSNEEIVNELNKCILMCRNCHGEIHNKLLK